MITIEDRRLIARFDGSAPRYTSYPTAPHFHDGVTAATYRSWLSRLPEDATLSLYTHIPYCGTLCWFCACRSQGVRNYAPISRYLEHLRAEIQAVSEHVTGKSVTHMHWGGGSPTILTPEDIVALAALQRERFQHATSVEFSVEIDPRDMTEPRMDALAQAGVTRVSLGVQDFDPEVQARINRRQSFASTRAVIDGMRARGVRSVNIDALYGLPKQTLSRLSRTIDQVIALSPDRVALFGYAHVPWAAKRQKLIDEAELPNAQARFEQAREAADRLVNAGYVRIGLDHFAKPDDAMAEACSQGRLRRNFQGYTVDPCDALLGFGASAIGRTPFGYVQNLAGTAAYQDAVTANKFAIARGVALSVEDRVRADAIESLMCQLRFDGADLTARYGDFARNALEDAARVAREMPPGLLVADEHGFTVTEAGRPFLRSIAAEFDAYLRAPAARYSRAI